MLKFISCVIKHRTSFCRYCSAFFYFLQISRIFELLYCFPGNRTAALCLVVWGWSVVLLPAVYGAKPLNPYGSISVDFPQDCSASGIPPIITAWGKFLVNSGFHVPCPFRGNDIFIIFKNARNFFNQFRCRDVKYCGRVVSSLSELSYFAGQGRIADSPSLTRHKFCFSRTR